MMIILPASLSVSVCPSIVRVGKKGFGGLPSLAVWARAAAGHRVLEIRRIIHVVLLSSLEVTLRQARLPICLLAYLACVGALCAY